MVFGKICFDFLDALSSNAWLQNPSSTINQGHFSRNMPNLLTEECDQCGCKYFLLRKKHHCHICNLLYCGSCSRRISGGRRRCKKCDIFSQWPIDKEQVSSLRVRDLRFFLIHNGITTDTCTEKKDLVELVIAQLRIKHHRGDMSSHQPSTSSHQRNDPCSSSGNLGDGIRVKPITVSPADQSTEYSLSDDGSGIRVFPSPMEQPPDPGATSPYEDLSNDTSTSSSWSMLNECPQENRLNEVSPEIYQPERRATSPPDDREPLSSSAISPPTSPESAPSSEPHSLSEAPSSPSSSSDPISGLAGSPSVPSNSGISHATTTTAFSTSPVGATSAQADISSSLKPTTTTLEPPTLHKEGLLSNIVKLSSLPDEESIKSLSVRQCKEILSLHRVDYSGVWEKHELVSKVMLLWQDFKKMNSDIDKLSEDQLCKICMAAPLNCVLLECGHMVSCTLCGKQLAECPICRQNVIRIVRTFRA